MAVVARGSTVTGGVFVTEVFGIPSYESDPAFNSTLTVSTSPSTNCKLKLILNIYLKAFTPSTLSDILVRSIAQALGVTLDPNTKYAHYPDWNKTPFLVKEWKAGEWQSFVNKFVGQAMMWDKKFCLMPPDDFVFFDIYQGGARYRPNVVCEFGINILGGPAGVHRTINVVNLNTSSASFRSDASNYTSDDTTPRTNPAPVVPGGTRNFNQPVITHEIGHALGLPHIGVTRNLPNCSIAIVLDSVLGDSAPALYKGGTAGFACYGHQGGGGDAANIMGVGDKFAPDNAKPWLDRLNDHSWMTFDMSKWKVSMTETPPMSIVNMAKTKLR